MCCGEAGWETSIAARGVHDRDRKQSGLNIGEWRAAGDARRRADGQLRGPLPGCAVLPICSDMHDMYISGEAHAGSVGIVCLEEAMEPAEMPENVYGACVRDARNTKKNIS